MYKEDFTELFSSAELWQVPIHSFIEVYCLIFTPSDEDEDLKTSRQGDVAERIRIYNDYKQLVNEILTGTIMSKRKVTRSDLYLTLSQVVAEEDYAMLSDPGVAEGLKYLLAVEDSRVFARFMEDMNILLNDQTEKKLAEARPR